MNTNYSEIKTKYFNLRQEVRETISKYLIDNTEDNPKFCDIVLESNEDCGLSSSLLPTIVGMWQNPTEG